MAALALDQYDLASRAAAAHLERAVVLVRGGRPADLVANALQGAIQCLAPIYRMGRLHADEWWAGSALWEMPPDDDLSDAWEREDSTEYLRVAGDVVHLDLWSDEPEAWVEYRAEEETSE